MIRPGCILGILGGGQLGRMIAMAAAQLGLRTHIYAPEENSPAFEVATEYTIAPYEDEANLVRFAKAVDVVTYEFENVPSETAAILSAHAPLAPNAQALAVSQDRFLEKSFIAGLGIAVAPFAPVSNEAELAEAVERIGRPAVLKTRRFGYDGKGQVKITPETDPVAAWEEIGRAASILEGFVPFEREVSVVAARTAAGAFAAYDLCANEHRNHILDTTQVPAGVSPETEEQAFRIARSIAEALDYVGVLAVELFLVTGNGSEHLVVNEIAPRVHNSGHWTLGGATTSQFEQHVRAVCGWPLGGTARLGRVEMKNLIGHDADAWEEILAEPGAQLHLYGKTEARAGRKMGHVTRVSPERN
ncbi:5-(carboxyamino)imidazole ribonucleotide synthase [Microvirga sp. Mcv34]|uniref:5-(carboxyamino)imidazole ribonucleotide synthase n=1 Tax=Microvirga sp. Mcv34 TaxID=2926016 RepID=UPI0021C9973B|nr:5-(carboxyamino)imidazole ribonucleotide synthase [Microvirga sp. Mcv34]